MSDYETLTTFFYTSPTVDTELFLHEKMNITSNEQAKEFLEVGKSILEGYTGDMQIDPLKEYFLAQIAEKEYKN